MGKLVRPFTLVGTKGTSQSIDSGLSVDGIELDEENRQPRTDSGDSGVSTWTDSSGNSDKSQSLDSGSSEDRKVFNEESQPLRTDSGDSWVVKGPDSSREKPLTPAVYVKGEVSIIGSGVGGLFLNKLNDLEHQKEPLTDFHDEIKYEGHTDTSDCYGDKRFWIKVFVIFAVLDVILFVAIFVVSFGLPGRSSPKQDPLYCLRCEDVYLSLDDITDNIYSFIISNGQCCSHNHTHIVHKYVLKRYKSDIAKASSKSSYPRRDTVHLELDRTFNYTRAGNNQHILKWDVLDARTSGNLTLSDDGFHIEVHRSGVYFLSTKVTFADNETDVGVALKPMLLQVYKKTGSEPRLLLEGKESNCAHTDTTCNIPSSIQGMFKLESGDSVEVHARIPCGLVMKRHLNQFDMYLI